MPRSSMEWRERLGDSRSSAPPVALRAVRVTAPFVPMATPDRHRRLSEGVLVEATIRARLLGVRLLTIDATVVLAPADVTAPSLGAHDPPASARSSGTPRNRSAASGHGLAEAVRSINEGMELLATTRRDGSPRRI
jgi:hypothetical protein